MRLTFWKGQTRLHSFLLREHPHYINLKPIGNAYVYLVSERAGFLQRLRFEVHLYCTFAFPLLAETHLKGELFFHGPSIW